MLRNEEFWITEYTKVSRNDLPIEEMSEKHHQHSIETILSFEVKAEMVSLCNNDPFNQATFILTVWMWILQKYTGQNRLSILTHGTGTSLSESKSPGHPLLIVNDRMDPEDRFKVFFNHIREKLSQAVSHQIFDLDQVKSKLLARGMTWIPVPFAFHYGETQYRINPEQTHLNLEVGDSEDTIQLRLTYTLRYNKLLVGFLFKSFVDLLNEVVADPKKKLKNYRYIDQDQNILLEKGTQTKNSDCAVDSTFIHQFQKQTKECPDRIAVVSGHSFLTYWQLDDLTNRVGCYLKVRFQITLGCPIGIMMEHSELVLVALMAILKTGSSFFFIDPQYPPERKRKILEETGAPVLITTASDIYNSLDFKGKIMAIDIELEIIRKSSDTLSYESCSSDPAYIIFTSGSTGVPKGIVVSHGSLFNYTRSIAEVCYRSGEFPQMPLFTTLSVDLTLTSIFVPLGHGGLVYLTKETDLNKQLMVLLKTNCWINTIKLTPSHISVICDLPIAQTQVAKVIVGGEALTEKHFNTLYVLNPNIEIFNEYGPAETTIGCTFQKVLPDCPISIGKPFGEHEIHILNPNLDVCPWGTFGEICIAGPGLALGYLNDQKLTAEKFTFTKAGINSKSIYRSGDLGRWLPQGDLELTGRNDDQVKIRGFRVELSEIERTLSNHESILEVKVLPKPIAAGENKVVAFIKFRQEESDQSLREYLSRYLPFYMIPHQFVSITRFPISSSGKIDRHKLLAASMKSEGYKAKYIAPRNAVERKLLDIWSKVLQKSSIGIFDNFFEVGGHSLKAAQITVRIHKEFKIKIELKEIFDRPSIAELAELIDMTRPSGFESIPQVEKQDLYIGSYGQQRLWVLNKLEKSSRAYNICMGWKLSGQIILKALEQAFLELIDRHEILRTSFVHVDGIIYQKIHAVEKCGFILEYQDIQSSFERRNRIKQITGEFVDMVFDLEKPPLIRASVIRQFVDEHILCIVLHHIISDGWSINLLIKELQILYTAIKDNGKNPLKPLSIQYKDFAAWQQQQLSGDRLLEHQQYWFRHFNDGVTPLDLPADRVRPSLKTFNGSNFNIPISSELSISLSRLAKNYHTSLFVIVLSALKILLYRYTGQNQIVIGTPSSGRNHIDLEDQLGLYINTLALSDTLQDSFTTGEVIEEVKANFEQALKYQNYPFDKLVHELHLSRDPSRSLLFDVMFVQQDMQTMPSDENQLNDLIVEDINTPSNISLFDFTISFVEGGEAIVFNFEYNSDLYILERVKRMSGHYISILQEIVRNTPETINKLNLLGVAEKKKICSFGHQSKAGVSELTLLEHFASTTNNFPKHTAIYVGTNQISYQDLNQFSDTLAIQLEKLLPDSGTRIVAILLDKSDRIPLTLLAVFKIGAIWMPLDVQSPEERINYYLYDSQADLIVTEEKYLSLCQSSLNTSVVNLDSINSSSDSTEKRRPTKFSQTDPAYILYTSGSTGLPKGVVIEHNSLLRKMYAEIAFHNLSETLCTCHTTNYAFDVSFLELVLPWIVGGSVVIPKMENNLDIQGIIETIGSFPITDIQATPSLMKIICDCLAQENVDNLDFSSIQRVWIGGESLHQALIKHISMVLPGVEINNHYGPTEVTIDAIALKNIKQFSEDIIGIPLADTEVAILNNGGAHQPIDVVGEICIHGSSVFRGYLNEPDLTNDVFLQDVKDPFKKFYRTGDLGKWLHSGQIQFMGRGDSQVKIRGHRVELKEVESCLQGHPRIEEAKVLVKKSTAGDNQLVGYLQNSSEEPQIEELQEFVTTRLPAYMIPCAFVTVDHFPLNSSGKIDIQALLDISVGYESESNSLDRPPSELEEKLIKIWIEVLGKELTNTKADFFELGGNSLDAVRVGLAVQRELKVQIQFEKLLTHSSVASMAEYIDTIIWLSEPQPNVENEMEDREIII